MARIGQIKGALLEEALLYLLDASGYVTVENVPSINDIDEYLENAGAGLCVLGRGEKHQIDAIADYRYPPPFTNPMRLLCEAKYYKEANVGIEVVRNAVGVKKDVEEYFRPTDDEIPIHRHHYQYAIFASTEFTPEAQRYAYAQDINLFEMKKSPLTKHLIDIIDNYCESLFRRHGRRRIFWNTDLTINLALLRKEFREYLNDE